MADHCSPDHPWPTATAVWYEHHIACSDCAKKYELYTRLGEGTALVKRFDADEIRKREAAWHRKGKDILRSPAVKDVFAKFKATIDGQRTVAAKYRLLHHFGLAPHTEGTFRRRFSGSETFTKSLSVGDLPKVLTLLGRKNPGIEADLAEHEELWARANQRIPNIKTGLPGLIA